MVDLAPLTEALFAGDPPLLDRAALPEAHASLEQRFWLLQDIQGLLERAAMDGPILICLDDLQWADNGTAAALRWLLPRLADLPVAWLLAIRPGQGSAQLLAALARLGETGAEVLHLEPLADAAVERVMADILEAEPDTPLLRAAGQAHGNPFLLVEYVRGLKEEGKVVVQSGRATLVDERLPARVGEDMRRRLTRMPGPAAGCHVRSLAGSAVLDRGSGRRRDCPLRNWWCRSASSSKRTSWPSPANDWPSGMT